MDDLIRRKALIAEYDRVHIGPPGGARKLMEEAPAVDAVVLPCKIGDEVWCIRKNNNKLFVKDGTVGEMFFSSKMELVISVKRVLKGRWGVDIFGSKAEAEEAARSMTDESGGKLCSDTICWDCKKAGGLCSWSSRLTPVDGWEVKETLIKFPEKVVSGFCVLRCPEFEEG